MSLARSNEVRPAGPHAGATQCASLAMDAYAADSPFMTKTEYAKRRRLSPRQVNRLMQNGKAPAYVREPGSRRVLFIRADVEARERANTHASPAAEAARLRAAEQHNPGESENHGG